jgi:CRISPR-associated protein Cas5/CasD subtype I-E
MGKCREDSAQALVPLTPLLMGVRVDRAGTSDWDYHTAGAKIGIRMAKANELTPGDDPDRILKRTASTGEYETLLSRRQYLFDASFLVALRGPADVIRECADKLNDPVWPVFLGRKCCVPAEPVFADTGSFDTMADALSVPWQPRIEAIDRNDRSATRTLDTFIEHPPGSQPPNGARLVYDVPRAFGFHSHGPRWVVAGQVTVSVDPPTHRRAVAPWQDPYGPEYDAARPVRLNMDNHLCVFCKSPAVQMHHLDYEDVRPETLRSVCKLCHDACTMLEYGHDMRTKRIDPSDKEHRPAILRRIKRLLVERRLGRRRELLASARTVGAAFFDDVPDSSAVEGH